MPTRSQLSPKNSAFLEKIKSSYPDFSFREGRKFLFRPQKSIFYLPENTNFPLLLLHETSHALLKHFSFSTPLERLQIERDAWEKTRLLCKYFSIPFDSDFAESELDSYRNWTHKKTLCKTCGTTCLSVNSESLFCPLCQKTFSI